LACHTTVIEWPLPDREEIAAILDAAINSLPEFETDKDGKPDPSKPIRSLAMLTNGARDAAVDAAIGLSGEEAAACYARSLVQMRRIDVATVAKEKQRVIAREGILEWIEPIPDGLSAVGGLENLKSWLLARKAAYSAKARAYGLPAPKGMFLVGVPGSGKSLLAKATATAWNVPLIRFDLGALKSKFVGESERNIRRALRVIEAIGRCVVWIDEIEKALQGATSGSSDGGVSSDALGTILSWMQERTSEAFVIATANDVTSLPPELLRKGRFDELWFCDLPTQEERVAILGATLRQYGRGDVEIDRQAVAAACAEFTGSEIAAIVPDSLFAGFADDSREITTEDLIASAKTVTPLAKTAAEKITTLRNWAVGRARLASAVVAKSNPNIRALDL
jgi:SpoVK/Ycf46/Vps4 family AAA+-type ATPase